MNENKQEVSKFIAFRCPTDLYNELLKNQRNMSKFIKNAIKSYKGKDFRDNLLNAFMQYSKLFHLIELHYKNNNRSTLGINEFINFINSAITNTKSIDKIEETIIHELS